MGWEVRRLKGLGQLGFDFCPAAVDESDPRQAGRDEVFLDAEPRELFVEAQRLDGYMREAGLGWVLRLGGLLAELDLGFDRPLSSGRAQGLSSK
jgi:hypothetical protein